MQSEFRKVSDMWVKKIVSVPRDVIDAAKSIHQMCRAGAREPEKIIILAYSKKKTPGQVHTVKQVANLKFRLRKNLCQCQETYRTKAAKGIQEAP